MDTKINLSLLCDFYEFTMSQGYLKSKKAEKICYFDIFFRQVPNDGTFAVFAGLQSIADFIKNLHFNSNDIDFFRSKKLFDEEFLAYLANFKFSGDIYALREGEIIFPNEPILSVRAKAIEAQLLETFLLLNINHQSLIATKANRIVMAAQGKDVFEFGSRRAHGIDSAIKGARAAFIGGCKGSSCTLAGKMYDIALSGTMAHSWVQMFDDEFEAFKAYCELYPHSAVLLIDTYNTLKSGLENAIKAFKEILVPKGIKEFAVRIDSGDLCELSKQIRKRLDDEGLKECKIIASGGLNEEKITSLVKNGAKIDAFGVGEEMITSKSSAVLGCVYKLVATEKDGQIIPKIKISESNEKISNPHFKKVYRFFDINSKKALYDKIYLYDEIPSKNENFFIEELQIPIFKNGICVYKTPNIQEIQIYARKRINTLDEQITSFKSKKTYEIKFSKKLLNLKNTLLKTYKGKK